MTKPAMPDDRESPSSAVPLVGPLTSRWLALPPVAAGVLAALLCFAAAAVGLWSFYENGFRLLKGHLRDGLRAGASVAAISVDPVQHATFKDRAQEGSPEYLQAIARLEAVRQALKASAPYRFIYTCVREADGIHFVLDPTPEGDADHDGVEDKSHIGDLYPEANPRLKHVFDSGLADVDEEPVVDSWGSALSGYAPVRDAAGKVTAVAGVDLELTEYNSEISRLQQVGLAGATGAAILSCLAGLVVKNYHQRLRGSVTRLVTAMHQARAGERAKSEFLATVSHELRTPLNGIVGMVGLLQQSPLNARQREQAEAVHRSGELLQLIIDDILDWSKIESGSLGITRTAVNLKTCLREVRDWFTPIAAEKDLTFEVSEESGCPEWFEGDPVRLRQVLMHLAGNAVKFTHEGGVFVSVRHESSPKGEPNDFPEENGRLVFLVRDTGIGIHPGEQEKIFEPFSQADSTTTRHYGGTGLGLAIGRRLCHAMGGEITLLSEPGHGSEFSFFTPCRPLPPPPSATADPDRRPSTPALPSASPANASGPVPSPASFPLASGLLPPGNASTTAASSLPPAPLAEDLPALLITPDRMLIQLANAVFKRLQRPFEHRPDLASARELLAVRHFHAILMDPEQVLDTEPEAPGILRQATLRPVAIIALISLHGEPPSPGFDAVLCRRLKMEDLEAALLTPPSPHQ